ncbi:MAG: DUF2334 domain-containing protein [Dehalococcoidia bacterium]
MAKELDRRLEAQRAMMCRGYSRREFFKLAGAATVPVGLAAAGIGSGVFDLNLLGMEAESAEAAPGQSLILYDGVGEFAWIGVVHAKMLTNLLGRFLPVGSTGIGAARKKISDYKRGDMANFDATFYIGHVYDNLLPQAFKDDLMTTTKPVVIIKYNIWQLDTGFPDSPFARKFGFNFRGLESPTTFSRVIYKGATFSKSTLDSEVGVTQITDATKARVIATARNDAGREIPYILKGQNLWYVADHPFAYIAEDDRYNVFADVLFDILGKSWTPTKRALVRLEDVSAISDPAQLRACANYLRSRNVPFAVATIPFYKDPTGYYNDGVAQTIGLSSRDGKDVREALKYMRTKGGELVMHGTTHQYRNIPNPYSAVSADDFEFFRVTENPDHSLTFHGPVGEDSDSWVRQVLDNGRRELDRASLPYIGFEAPHYAASAIDYKAIGSKFKLSYHRNLYFEREFTSQRTAPRPGRSGQIEQERRRQERTQPTSDNTRVTAEGEPERFGGQFYPYVVQRDVYGQRLLPENLNNIEPERWPDPVAGPFPQRLPQHLIADAQRNRVLRDAWASFYFHPFFDISFLKQTVEGIQAAGYTFVKASAVTV